MQRLKALLINKQIENPAKAKTRVATTDTDKKRIREVLVYLPGSMHAKTPLAILYHPKMEYGVNRAASTDKQSDEFEHLVQDAANITGVPVLSTGTFMKAGYL